MWTYLNIEGLAIEPNQIGAVPCEELINYAKQFNILDEKHHETGSGEDGEKPWYDLKSTGNVDLSVIHTEQRTNMIITGPNGLWLLITIKSDRSARIEIGEAAA